MGWVYIAGENEVIWQIVCAGTRKYGVYWSYVISVSYSRFIIGRKTLLQSLPLHVVDVVPESGGRRESLEGKVRPGVGFDSGAGFDSGFGADSQQDRCPRDSLPSYRFVAGTGRRSGPRKALGR